MRTSIIIKTSRQSRWTIIILYLSMTMIFYANVLADNNEELDERTEKQELRSRQARMLTSSSARIINNANEALQEDNFSEALELLDSLIAKGDRLNNYDQAKAYQFYAYVYINQENYDKAIEFSELALSNNVLEEASTLELLYTLASLHVIKENYHKALEHLQNWFIFTDIPHPQAYFMAAQIHAMLDQYDRALEYASTGMALHRKDTDFKANENWFRLFLAIQLNLKDYAAAVPVLEEMLGYWPDREEYFQQLGSLYQEVERSKESLAIFSIAYHNNLLTDAADVERLMQLHRLFDYPYRGAVMMERSLNTRKEQTIEAKSARNQTAVAGEEQWSALSGAWLQAREWERANSALIEAAKLSAGGEHWLVLCQTAMQDEQWRLSRQYCSNARDKGGLENDEGKAWQLTGLAHYREDNLTAALEAFNRCQRWQDTQQECQSWRNFVDQEIRQQRQEEQRLEAAKQAELRKKRERNELIQNL